MIYKSFFFHSLTVLCFYLPDSGKVIKAINANSADSVRHVNPVVIEELQVFGAQEPVRSLKVVKGVGNGAPSRLIAVSDTQVQSLRLHRCNSDKITSCRLVPFFCCCFINHKYLKVLSVQHLHFLIKINYLPSF